VTLEGSSLVGMHVSIGIGVLRVCGALFEQRADGARARGWEDLGRKGGTSVNSGNSLPASPTFC
jgi:hypothetical protein